VLKITILINTFIFINLHGRDNIFVQRIQLDSVIFSSITHRLDHKKLNQIEPHNIIFHGEIVLLTLGWPDNIISIITMSLRQDDINLNKLSLNIQSWKLALNLHKVISDDDIISFLTW
jgi:hypothetical protein